MPFNKKAKEMMKKKATKKEEHMMPEQHKKVGKGMPKKKKGMK